MRFLLALLFTILSFNAYSQVLLTNSEYVSAFYAEYQLPDSSEQTDKWRITVTLKNWYTDDLYYSSQHPGAVSATNNIPYYLEVKAKNALTFKADVKDVAATLMIDSSPADALYFYGTGTMKTGPNKSNLFRVKPIRIEKSFTITVAKGERPEVIGEFVIKLLPLDKIK